ncbi:MAG: hypothetical protein KKB31_05740 [Nanoarchaeota archaeon]|nr:hypothetical protein [Nanoarchaeota archaeon]
MNTEVLNSWVDLEKNCPINISRIISHANEFSATLPQRITINNLNKSKESLFSARSYLDSMINALVQTLYNREILKTSEDKIIFSWISDNLGRFMRKLDEQEDYYLIKFDEPTDKSLIGISRLSAYSQKLKTASDSLIYETLLKSTEEYQKFKETEETKREPKVFLYILFQVLNVTLSLLGGITREKGTLSKKSFIQTSPISYQNLMEKRGQKLIQEGFKEEFGKDYQNIKNDIDIFDEPIEEEMGDEEDED